MDLVRLHKFLAECGLGSRRRMEELISEGKVRVNGRVVTEQGTKIDPIRDRIEVKNKLVRPTEKGVLIMNKPRGVVTTMSDPEGRPSIADYLTKRFRSYYPVGRLDWDSTGLLICTNDGELAERLMHPRYGLPRTYHARVEGKVQQSTADKIKRGVRLADGPARADVEIMHGDEKSTWVEVTVTEGRNRLVRRLFERVEHPVMKLKRISHGPLKLGKLQPGEIRPLTQSEYEKLRSKLLGTPLSGKKKEVRSEVRRESIDRSQTGGDTPPDRKVRSDRSRPARPSYAKKSRPARRRNTTRTRWGR